MKAVGLGSQTESQFKSSVYCNPSSTNRNSSRTIRPSYDGERGISISFQTNIITGLFFLGARHWQKSQLACFHCAAVLTLLLSNKYLNLGRAGKLVKITGEGRPVETRLATVLVVETNAVF